MMVIEREFQAVNDVGMVAAMDEPETGMANFGVCMADVCINNIFYIYPFELQLNGGLFSGCIILTELVNKGVNIYLCSLLQCKF